MRISMNESCVEDLLCKSFDQFVADFRKGIVLLFECLNITDFNTVDEFGSQYSLLNDKLMKKMLTS